MGPSLCAGSGEPSHTRWMVAGSGADTSGVARAALWNLHPALQLLGGEHAAADY